MLRGFFNICVIVFVLLMASLIWASDEHWSSLDGPYWANGIDVAYGASGDGQEWHRYLIGADGSDTKLFFQRAIEPYWFPSIPLPNANRLISYRNAENGKYAFCAASNDDIRTTDDGGINWRRMFFPQNFNRQFSAVEVNHYNPATHLYVGCLQSGTEASAYQTTNGGLDWDPIGTGLSGLAINDLEMTAAGETWLIAATDQGLFRHHSTYAPDWEPVTGDLAGQEIIAVEPIEHDQFMWAATGVIDNHRRLYYSRSDFPPWDEGAYEEVLVGDPPAPFDKTVADMAVLLHQGNWQSVYIAAEEGLYLLDVEGVDPLQNVQCIDFQNDPRYSDFPFKYDSPVISVDYYMESESASSRQILVGTEHSVYLLTEERDGEYPFDIVSITLSDISEGTFLSNPTSATFPEYNPASVKSSKLVYLK